MTIDDLHDSIERTRSEIRTDVRDLSAKLDVHIAKVADHETRLVPLENFRRTAKWVGGTIVGTGLTALASWFEKHR